MEWDALGERKNNLERSNLAILKGLRYDADKHSGREEGRENKNGEKR